MAGNHTTQLRITPGLAGMLEEAVTRRKHGHIAPRGGSDRGAIVGEAVRYCTPLATDEFAPRSEVRDRRCQPSLPNDLWGRVREISNQRTKLELPFDSVGAVCEEALARYFAAEAEYFKFADTSPTGYPAGHAASPNVGDCITVHKMLMNAVHAVRVGQLFLFEDELINGWIDARPNDNRQGQFQEALKAGRIRSLAAVIASEVVRAVESHFATETVAELVRRGTKTHYELKPVDAALRAVFTPKD